MKTLKAGLASALLVAGLGLAPAAPAAAAPYCGITWGSLADSASATSTARVVNARAGQHTCYDRLVLDLKGKVRGYDVRYVSAVYTEGQGKRVPLDGAADLRIIVRTGNSTYAPASRTRAVNVSGFRTFEQVAYLGSFEGQTSFGLGVRARLPFRTFILDGPGTGSRLVIDVAHRW
ncbi:MAG TPA: hypothetical protein VN621_09985 [Arthrobacter sp.]|nr:hypothetical protein [Arthrobacter sp.]